MSFLGREIELLLVEQEQERVEEAWGQDSMSSSVGTKTQFSLLLGLRPPRGQWRGHRL
jgi:hypothetical protein